MHDFGVYLRLGMMIFMVSTIKKKLFGKVFEVWNQIWKVLGCGWRM